MSPRSQLRVAFQGEPGAFSEEAVRKLLGGGIRAIPRPTFESLFRAVRQRAADCILVPLENSLAGAVPRNYDLLLASRLSITAEVVLPIAHHLIACPGARLRDITAVQSHPVALAQCERFFSAHPDLARLAADDTAGSVREVVERGDQTRAAIGSAFAAARYGGRILRRHLEDHRKNFTRFVLAAASGHRLKACATWPANKLSLVLELRHRPGALCCALQQFADAGFNLLKIESRPIPGRPWEYRFYLDVRTEPRGGSRRSSDAAALPVVLTALKRATTRLRVLGHYRSA